MGYTSLAIGLIALFVSSSDSNIKSVAPILSPHLAQLDSFLVRMQGLENVAIDRLSKVLPNVSSGAPLQPHPQVVEMPCEDTKTPNPLPSTVEGNMESEDELLVEKNIDFVDDSQEGLRKRRVSTTWRSSTSM